jgi:hypothetical protein
MERTDSIRHAATRRDGVEVGTRAAVAGSPRHGPCPATAARPTAEAEDKP